MNINEQLAGQEQVTSANVYVFLQLALLYLTSRLFASFWPIASSSKIVMDVSGACATAKPVSITGSDLFRAYVRHCAPWTKIRAY